MKSASQFVILNGLDRRLPSLAAAKDVAAKPARGWLKAVRTALGLSQGKVAAKLTTSQQAYASLEDAEQRGAITLTSLQRAAEAMDCELVYFLVPQQGRAGSFAALAQEKDPAFRHLRATEHSMVLEDQAVGDLKPRPSP